MTKADVYMYEAIKKILNEGVKDENPRPHYADGTPAHTIFINHVMRSYDLSKGEFPICTLRPIAWKTGIREIMAIYQNQSNKISEFERCGCGWWADWTLEDGTIGRAYPYNLESHRPNEMNKSVVKVTPKIVPMTMGNKIGDFSRTTYGVGYLGKYKKVNNFTPDEIKILKNIWKDMFKKCYSDVYITKHPECNGDFVHQDWHSFEQFLRDVRNIPQYFLAREDNFIGWSLNKNYFVSNCYSKDTCAFICDVEAALYDKVNGCYKIIDTRTNKIVYDLNLARFAANVGINGNALIRTVEKGNGETVAYKHFIIEYFENADDMVYRFELSRNQIVGLINDIKNNPYGRRHITSFWHWANIDKKSLVECAYETIWNVRGEYLDMKLVQRSGDMLTASGPGGINEVQYASLLMMIARETGYKPGVFSHVVANEQIYDRHIDAAHEMLRRYEAMPHTATKSRLVLNKKADKFFNMTVEDFSIENYEAIKPQLKLELGI